MRGCKRAGRAGSAALVLAAVLAAQAVATTALVARPPASLPPTVLAPPVEIYFGITRVNPPAVEHASIPLAPTVVTAAARFPAAAHANSEAMAGALQAVREGTRSVSFAACRTLDRVTDRMLRSHDSRPSVIVTYAQPPASNSTSGSVGMDSGTVLALLAARNTPPERSISFAGVAVGILAGIGIACLAWLGFRRFLTDRPAPTPAVTVPAPETPGLTLQGLFDAGDMAPAEKFEAGPTFQEEKKLGEQQQAQNEQAVVQFILDQNLAVLSAIGTDQKADAPITALA